jgi:hypothetical protein
MSDQKSQAITLTADQLKEMLVTMAAEIRRPADPTPQQAAEIENNRRMREDRAQIELQKIAHRRLEQSMCDHSREDGSGACVPVYNNQNGIDFLACQSCQAIIHAGERPTTGDAAKDTENHIFDTQIYNRELRRYSRRPTSMLA